MHEIDVKPESGGEGESPTPPTLTEEEVKPKYDKSKEKWTPEKRKALELAKLQSPYSLKCSQQWTPEMRAAAKQRIIDRNAKAKDDAERQARRNKTRYLKKINTGELFVWNPHLALRKDMVEVKDELPENAEKDSD